MKSISIICILLLTASFAFGQKEHLNPEADHAQNGGMLKDYFDKLFQVLHEGFSTKPVARYTCLPSFTGEYAFSLEKNKDKQYLMANKMPSNYWYSDDRRKVQLIHNQAVIDPELHDKIAGLFQILAEQTKEPEQPIYGMDGRYYYFSTTDPNGHVKTGETWSPRSNSLLEKLVTICDNLFSLANGEPLLQSDIAHAIDELILDLSK
jgi:hypothetical protein